MCPNDCAVRENTNQVSAIDVSADCIDSRRQTQHRKRRMSFALVECHVAAVIGGGAFVGWEIGMGGPGRAIQSV